MVSIVIPLYNKEQSICKTIESVLQQTYTDFELIVVDNGSTDGSLIEVSKIHDKRIRLLHQPIRGVSAARNMGIRASNTEYVALLDGDDLWDKSCLMELVQLTKDFPDAESKNIYSEEEDIDFCWYVAQKAPSITCRGVTSPSFDTNVTFTDWLLTLLIITGTCGRNSVTALNTSVPSFTSTNSRASAPPGTVAAKGNARVSQLPSCKVRVYVSPPFSILKDCSTESSLPSNNTEG